MAGGSKVFGYIRLSKEDRDSTSPARQRERIERLCADRGWQLLEVFSDIDRSAFNGKHRPAFSRMMGRLADVDAIVFWRLDRLSRSVSDFSKLLDSTQAAGVQLVSTDQPIDTSSAMGKAFVQITSVFAELEAGTTSERSRQMHAYKREHGEFVGRVPFGWRREGKGLAVAPREQAVLAKAARRFVAGETLSAIARDLDWPVQTLSRRMRNARVMAALPADVELSKAIAEREQPRVAKNAKSLLGGIARCGVCGDAMTLSSTRAGRRSGRWASYACRKAGHVHISAGWLDGFVAERIVEAVDTGRLVKALRRRQKLGAGRRVSELEARLEVLEHDHYVAGKIPAGRFERLRDALLVDLTAAQEQEREASAELPAELAARLGELWPSMLLRERRRVVAAVLSRIDVAKAIGNGPIDAGRVLLVWR